MEESHSEKHYLLASDSSKSDNTVVNSPETINDNELERSLDYMESNTKNLVLVNLVSIFVSLGTQICNVVLPQYMYSRVAEMLYNGTNVSMQEDQTRTVCFQNESDPNFKIQQHVQQVTTEKLLSLTLSNSIPVIFTVILVGAYVDYLGRKIIFIIAIFGHLSRNLCLAVVVYWKLDTDFLFIGYALDACCGGFCAFTLVSYAFVADHTARSKSRTFVMGLLTLCMGLANTFGYVITGYFIQNVGYFYPMVTSASTTLVGLFIAICCVSETLVDRPKTFVSPMRGIQNVFKFYYHEDYAEQRHLFWLAAIGFFCLLIGPLVSNMTIDTLYELNAPFCWDPIKIGWFSTATMALFSLGGLLFLRVMQRWFSDGTIAMFGVVSIAAKEFYVSFCNSDMMLYFAPVIGMFAFAALAVIRSVISQMVPKERQGAIFASVAFVEALMYASGGPVFNMIYKATVGYYRGVVYFVMGTLHILDFFIFLCLFIKLAAYKRRERLLKEKENHYTRKYNDNIVIEYEYIE